MTTPTEGQGMVGDAIPPPIARVLLRFHEAVASATEQAYVDLRDLGIPEPAVLIRGRMPAGSP